MFSEIVPIAGMIFILLATLIAAGRKLLEPLMPRLGEAMDQRLEERRAGTAGSSTEMAELREVVEEMQKELLRLSEQQEFTQRLLEDRSAPDRTPATDWVGEPG